MCIRDSSNITTVAGNNSNITTVAGANSNITTVAGSIANVNTVATNISGVNDFADRYRVASSAPGSDNDEGDLYFNTTSNELQVYNGSAWQGGVTATGDLVAKSGDTMTGNLVMDNQAAVRFEEATANGSNYVALQAPASLSADVTWTLPTADGTSGQRLQTNGSGALSWGTDSTTDSTKMPLAGGTFTGNVLFANGKATRFYENDGNGSNYVGFRAPAALSADTTFYWPAADGSANQLLTTDGSGNLSFADAAAAGATGGGNDEIFVENERTVTTSYSITATKNAHSVGPIAVNSSAVVTIPENSTWMIV